MGLFWAEEQVGGPESQRSLVSLGAGIHAIMGFVEDAVGGGHGTDSRPIGS